MGMSRGLGPHLVLRYYKNLGLLGTFGVVDPSLQRIGGGEREWTKWVSRGTAHRYAVGC